MAGLRIIGTTLTQALWLAPALAANDTIAVDLDAARVSVSSSSTGHVGALVVPHEGLVTWIDLPLVELPEAVLPVNESTLALIARRGGAGPELITLDVDASTWSATSLDELLPVGASLGDGPAAAAMTAAGPCVVLPLSCGSLAVVEPAANVPDGASVDVCTVILAPRLELGADGWIRRGREHMREGRIEDARTAFSTAIEAAPSDPQVYRAMADFHRRAGENQACLDCFRLGIERILGDCPTSASPGWRVGTPAARLVMDHVETVRALRGDDAATAALDDAQLLYPCMEEAVLLRAELFLTGGSDRAAVSAIRIALRSIESNEELASASHDVARFFRRHDRTELALEFLENAWVLGDRSDFLVRELSEIHVERGEYEEAAEWLTRIVERWRAEDGDAEDDERRRRAAERLAALEEEIAELYRIAASSSEDDR